MSVLFFPTSDAMEKKGGSDLVSIVSVVERDFKRIENCEKPEKIPDPTKAILSASTHKTNTIIYEK